MVLRIGGRVRRPLLWTFLSLGVALGGGVGAWIGLASDRNRLLLVAATELAAGRETALSTGLAAGVAWSRAATVTLGIEWTMLLVGAPLLILFGDVLRERPFLRKRLARAEAYAATRPRTGIVALSALTLMPFFPLGALTSVLIGEVLTLPQRKLIPALLASEVVANFAFAFLASQAIGLLPDPRMGAGIIAGTLLLAVIAVALWPRKRAQPTAE